MGSYSLFSNVPTTTVEWLWYSYIPCGKITILQGDPGDGKSTLIMDIIGRLTTGRKMPDGRVLAPINVLYQCSEDGLADTIKPRLERAKADCKRVGYINEDIFGLTLDDEKIRTAMIEMDARLLVVDPFQAYIGDADMSNANGMRRILRRLGMWAAAYNCAVVLVGHLNKRSASKELYRGLGSIDLIASARSVIQIERDEENENIRKVKHIKSSLAPKGENIAFTIDDKGMLLWLEDSPRNSPLEVDGEYLDEPKTKQERVAVELRRLLSKGPVEASILTDRFLEEGCSLRTVKLAKITIGIISRKVGKKWYWSLPTENKKNPELMERKKENDL